MDKTTKQSIGHEMSDDAVLSVLGERVKQMRLKAEGGHLTQKKLADRAGVGRTTIVALEQGKGKMEVLVSVLRALSALDELDEFLSSASNVSPIQVARMQGRVRQRAGTARKKE
ncbi:MAG: helix-turn-helix transcriptional regulator [Porticoccus sp.]|nr:helix-turn-helix transcriptional regulator [Porticoccus sp.]MBQ0808311.1 helix-turn-helix transcriptional regulator [Porticoccus sp.]